MKKLALAAASLLLGCGSEPPPRPVTPPGPPPVAKAAPVDCGPELPGFDKVSAAPLLIFGEMHGQVGPPALAANAACRQAVRAGSATLALEIPRAEQPLIDAYLGSDGGDAAKAALLQGAFWTRATQDGRSSGAMLGVLEKSRGWVRGGLALRVATADGDGPLEQAPREKVMADAIVGFVHEKKGPVVMLVGNFHARTAVGLPWDPTLKPMGAIAKEQIPDLVSLDVRYGAGTGWVCWQTDECGPKPMRSHEEPAPAGTIARLDSPDEAGFSGTYSVGAAVASAPARPLTPEQQAAAVVGEFRSANEAHRGEHRPADSVLSLEERKSWCERLVPVARARVPRPGDRVDGNDPCALVLIPDSSRQLVPDVKVRFDLDFFYARPSKKASYDRGSKTLFLPLSAAVQPWDELAETKHEWLRASVHAKATTVPLAAALMMTVEGKDYPTRFSVDEIPVTLCEIVHPRAKEPISGPFDRIIIYVKSLRKELDALKTQKKGTPVTRDGVPGTQFSGADGTERWVGGKNPKRSLALLEGAWRDADKAITPLHADPPDLATASAVPLLAGGLCSPK